MVRSTFGKYQRAKRQNPSATEPEIAAFLLKDRYRILHPKPDEAERLEALLATDPQLVTLMDVCLAIAEIEFGPRDSFQRRILVEVISEELGRLGYVPQ